MNKRNGERRGGFWTTPPLGMGAFGVGRGRWRRLRLRLAGVAE